MLFETDAVAAVKPNVRTFMAKNGKTLHAVCTQDAKGGRVEIT
jgi:hypothetical protein